MTVCQNNINNGYPDIDEDLLIGNISEIVPNTLFLHASTKMSKNKLFAEEYHMFLFMESFIMSHFIKILDHGIYNHVEVETKRGRKIVIYCCDRRNGEFDRVRVNCAYVLASYLIIYHGLTADDAFLAVSSSQPPKYIGFRDASMGEPTYLLQLHQVLRGVEKALKHGWLDFSDFDYQEYEYYEKVENGDFNWIIPDKILSFCGPHNESRIDDGYPYHAPSLYFEYFRARGISTIVRLNAKNYDANKFIRAGFDHVDLFFVDGSTPSDEIVEKFIKIVDNAKGGVAVHCKAGLGRTGTLIACWMMKEYGLTACECMAWLRICRPGSVIGPQQRFLIDKQKMCWAMSKSNGVHLPKGAIKDASKKGALNKLTNKIDKIHLDNKETESNGNPTKSQENKRPRPNILPLRRKTSAQKLDQQNGNVSGNDKHVADETALDEKGRSQGDRLLALKAKHQHEKTNQKEQRSMTLPSQAYLNKNREPMPRRQHSPPQQQQRSPIMYRTRTPGVSTNLSRTPASAIFPSMASRRSDVSRFSSPTTPIKPMSPSANSTCSISGISSLRLRQQRLRDVSSSSSQIAPSPQFGLIRLPANSYTRPLTPHNYSTRSTSSMIKIAPTTSNCSLKSTSTPKTSKQ
ncbi:unnamed protein product [Caenorhabditis angaria]|uniref:protein-tyrosine-phosphatase n=1 Tax=Caenorhabditis angaria TaxID=860376 RepID=A0A9P1MWI1_9PELO|nr:unnamed protein product [Caenorhabditis angaria]